MLLLLSHILSTWPFKWVEPTSSCQRFLLLPEPTLPNHVTGQSAQELSPPWEWSLMSDRRWHIQRPSSFSPKWGAVRCVLSLLPGVSVDTDPFLWVVAHLIIHLDWLIIHLFLLTSPPATLPPTGVFLGSSPTLAMTPSQLLGVSTLQWDRYVGSPQELVALDNHQITWWPQITTLDLSFYLERR